MPAAARAGQGTVRRSGTWKPGCGLRTCRRGRFLFGGADLDRPGAARRVLWGGRWCCRSLPAWRWSCCDSRAAGFARSKEHWWGAGVWRACAGATPVGARTSCGKRERRGGRRGRGRLTARGGRSATIDRFGCEWLALVVGGQGDRARTNRTERSNGGPKES